MLIPLHAVLIGARKLTAKQPTVAIPDKGLLRRPLFLKG